MTDAELRDAAVAKLKQTTVGYKNKHWTVPPEGSNWDSALDLLAQIAVEDPPPPPPPPDPEPVPVTLKLGINMNNDPSSWMNQAGSLNPKSIREGVMTSAKVSFAAAEGATVIKLLNRDPSGLASSLAEVNQWPQITHWELDNEPYFRGVNVAAWARSARDLARAITQAHPSHTVICPMLVQTNGGDYRTDGIWKPWATQVLDAAPDLPQWVDAWSGHPYSPGKSPQTKTQANGSLTTMETVDKVRAQLVARGADKPWHMTEFGWSVGTGGTPPNTQVSAADQARFLNDLVLMMRQRPWIRSAQYYCLQTWGTGYEHSFGLFNQDKSDRPAAVTFRNLV